MNTSRTRHRRAPLHHVVRTEGAPDGRGEFRSESRAEASNKMDRLGRLTGGSTGIRVANQRSRSTTSLLSNGSVLDDNDETTKQLETMFWHARWKKTNRPAFDEISITASSSVKFVTSDFPFHTALRTTCGLGSQVRAKEKALQCSRRNGQHF